MIIEKVLGGVHLIENWKEGAEYYFEQSREKTPVLLMNVSGSQEQREPEECRIRPPARH